MAIGYTLIALLGSFSIWTLVSYLPVGIGFSLAIINVYPMTIENCSPKDTGKYTGFYYIASMSAQTITPALVGLFISEVLPIGSMTNLFPYATIFILLAALTASFGKKVG
jgi:MFS family permease